MIARIMTVVGARPQFIKAAPVSKAFAAASVDEILVHTGQHFDAMMSDIFFEELDLAPPAYNLEIHSLNHGAMTARMLEGVESLILKERPAMLLVYGDTNSTLAGALAAAKLNVPVAHVEAGLRSFNRRMPEEINRVATDHMSELLFCPTTAAVTNLANEGITAGVFATGDVMYDATLAAVGRARGTSRILERLQLNPETYTVATIHRAENTDDPARFDGIIEFLEAMARDQTVVLVVHPRTKSKLQQGGRTIAGVRLVDPLGYLDMAWLVANARQVATDSGGLQKEAYFHRRPCITLRSETEWVETIASGWNRLWTDEDTWPTVRTEIADYGDGSSAHLIAAHIKAFLERMS